jgi:hypothetical protein
MFSLSNGRASSDVRSYWTWLSFVSYFFSAFLYFIWLPSLFTNSLFDTVFRSRELFGVGAYLLSKPIFYLCVLLTVGMCILPVIFIKALVRAYKPKDFELVQELQGLEASERKRRINELLRIVDRTQNLFRRTGWKVRRNFMIFRTSFWKTQAASDVKEEDCMF